MAEVEEGDFDIRMRFCPVPWGWIFFIFRGTLGVIYVIFKRHFWRFK